MALKRIAYVQASWHTDITDHCRAAFMAELTKHGYTEADVELFSVPGIQPRYHGGRIGLLMRAHGTVTVDVGTAIRSMTENPQAA